MKTDGQYPSVFLYLEIYAGACFGVGADEGVCNEDVFGVDRVCFERILTLERRVEHKVGIGTRQTFGVNLDVNKSFYFSFKGFEVFLNAFFDVDFFFLRKFVFQLP